MQFLENDLQLKSKRLQDDDKEVTAASDITDARAESFSEMSSTIKLMLNVNF